MSKKNTDPMTEFRKEVSKNAGPYVNLFTVLRMMCVIWVLCAVWRDFHNWPLLLALIFIFAQLELIGRGLSLSMTMLKESLDMINRLANVQKTTSKFAALFNEHLQAVKERRGAAKGGDE